MNRSESITKLAAALVKFNNEVSSIPKDAKNPFFKSEYVTLDKLIISTRDILQKNGLSVMQFPLSVDGKIGIQTILLHESGEFIESEPLFMTPVKLNDPQNAGSIISYLRRYSYQAILNLNTGEDDDGNLATFGNTSQGSTKGNNFNQRSSQQTNKNLTEAQINRLKAISKAAGYSVDKLTSMIKQKYNKKPEELTREEYDHICNSLEKK